MSKRFRKLAAIVLASSMLVQSGAVVLAEEGQSEIQTEAVQTEAPTEKQTEAPTEKQTEAPTEKQTEAPTEKQTEAPTEKQTEAPTEKQTEAPTEKQTEAPTEKQTEAPTEKQTEAPTEKQTEALTEKQTEAPTEKQTEAPAEKQTEAPAKKETKKSSKKRAKKSSKEQTEKLTEEQTEKLTEEQTEKLTEEQTERSERRNDGEKFSVEDLLKKLKQALPYLLAAGKTDVPEGLLEEQEVAADSDGSAVVKGLEDFSLKLANAKASSKVQVLNLYADKDGKLDVAQLDDKFSNHVIDVTKQYYVVNVIADSEDQTLSFSGYEMQLDGETVKYTEGTEPGDILYNFAVMDDKGEFSGYKGSLTLGGTDRLQGTFLAPQAQVTVNSDLAGAVYADSVTVADSVKELLQIVFAKGRQVKVQTEEISEVPGKETDGSNQDAKEAEGDGTKETEEEDMEVIDANQSSNVTTVIDVGGVQLGVKLVDAADVNITLDGVVSVMSAEHTSDGRQTVYEADEKVAEESATVNEPAELGSELQYSGNYYLTAEASAEGYERSEPRLFTISEDGMVTFIGYESGEWDQNSNELILPIASEGDGEQNGSEPTADPNATATPSADPNATTTPSTDPTEDPNATATPSAEPTADPNATATPSAEPTADPNATATPSAEPTADPNATATPSAEPTADPNATATPSAEPTADPNATAMPSAEPTADPNATTTPSAEPTADPNATTTPSAEPTVTPEPEQPTGTASFSTSVKVLFDGQALRALTGASDNTLPYVALFRKDEPTDAEAADTSSPEADSATPAPDTGNESQTLTVAVQKVRPVFSKDGDSGTIRLEKLPAGTYILKLADDKGLEVQPADGEDSVCPILRRENESDGETGTIEITIGDDSNEYTLPDSGLVLDYGKVSRNYPTQFYYEASVEVTKELRDNEDKAKMSEETFYAGLFADANHTKPITETVTDAATGKARKTPVVLTFSMDGKSSATASYDKLKATASPMRLFVAETDAQGKVIEGKGEGQSQLYYAIILQDGGKMEVTPSAPSASSQITNRLDPALVKIGVLHDMKHLPGVTLVVKDVNGKVLTAVDQKKSFQSGSDYLELKLPNGTYYLSEVNAPSGYAPAEDKVFKVEDGKVTTVALENEVLQATNYKMTVSMQVFSGQYQLYARDTSNSYVAERTFYVALFRDAERKIKVSNVSKIVMDGLSTSVEFRDLKPGETYFVAETDEYGEVKQASSGYQIKYANSGIVPMDAGEKTTVIQNIYNQRPNGYSYSGTVTITKRVTDASGAAQRVTDTFYVGMFTTPDCSGTPAATISLSLENASGASVRRRIVYAREEAPTYYFAELDANGNRVENSDTFAYNVSIDQPSITVARGEDKAVTVTNQAKSTKVTLYLTKRVYEGTALHPVTDTFYMGLFQDAQFTKLYTNPIPLSLKNQSELTLKITLNLGTKANAVIYIAETDKSGHVIQNESQFGYNIRAVNSTAMFTQQVREIQTIFLNSRYGSATDDDWKEIMSDENNIPSYGGSDGWYGGNGQIDPNVNTSSVQTGDETPIGLYIGLLAAAVVILILLLILRMRGRKRK